MFFLTKLFQLRDNSNPEAEKPFLAHLEDLRITVTRIVLTLSISTLVCFFFNNELMDVLRKPIEEVWVMKHEETLPEDIPLEDWEKALSFASVSPTLEAQHPQLAEKWWQDLDEERLRPLTRAAIVYRASMLLPEEKRVPFIEQLPESEQATRDLSLRLLEKLPAADLNASGNLRLMSSLKPTETFMLTMKLAFFAGVVVSFPFLLYFLLQFILPGLKEQERKALWPALAIGFGLFLVGVLFAYFFVLPRVLTFFYDWGQELGISNDWRIGYYISFATQFVLIFGLAFELPVVVMTLVRLEILSHSMMRDTRSYAILAIFVIAAVITPTPDALTLFLLAGPMYLLYELCIWLSYFHEKKRNRLESEEEEERMKYLLADPDDSHPEEDFEEETDDGEEITDDDDYMDYPGEHQNPDDEPEFDPLAPDEDQDSTDSAPEKK